MSGGAGIVPRPHGLREQPYDARPGKSGRGGQYSPSPGFAGSLAFAYDPAESFTRSEPVSGASHQPFSLSQRASISPRRFVTQ